MTTTDAELDALVAAITPHELTGDTAAVMIDAGKLRQAADNITGLMKMLHTALARESATIASYEAKVERLEAELDAARKVARDISADGVATAIKYGFTEEQYRAAKRIEFSIFGPYEWQSQEDLAAHMVVRIMDALREAEAHALTPEKPHE